MRHLPARPRDGGPATSNMGGSLIAFSPPGSGEIVDGWPVELPARTHALDLSVDVDGRLVARGYVCGAEGCGSEGTVETTLIYAPDGTLLEQAPSG